MKRYKHTLSNYRLQSGNMGQLMPVACIPVLPGDTVQHHTSALIRLSPLNTPVMHPVQVRIHHFFVPNRIVWPEWETFITGGEDGMDMSEIPTITTTAEKNTILHRLGVPAIAGVDVSALPVYAFNKIYNEFYRDQHLVTPRDDDNITIPHCAWEKDGFTSSRPWTQLGPDVTLPVGSTAPIKIASGAPGGNVLIRDDLDNQIDLHTDLSRLQRGTAFGNGDELYADLAAASAPSVNDFRAAFSLQRYQEARARYGSRFTEYLRYLGITPSDARLQRPEYLGGGVSRLSFSEVLQTSPTPDRTEPDGRDELGVGDMYGHGIAGTKTNKYRKFFEEHGYIISILSVRPKSVYVNGIPRDWLKTTKEDFFQKELANLGQQPVYQAELYAENSRDTFGFQDRYHEYRWQPSQVLGDMTDVLNAWHLGRELQSNVTLNEDFITCDPSRRIFQITDETVDSLWCMINNHIVARRIVPKRANPRIL